MSLRRKNPAILVCRLILAAVFLFSGFVKGADPWGTAIKLGEYFSAFGLGSAGDVTFVLSVLLSAVEMTLGLGLLFAVGLRPVGFCTFWFMTGFTLLTLWIALTDPVADCGCFGDAVKLTNWQTFWKNVVLWPMSAAVWLWARKGQEGSGGGYADPAAVYARSLGGIHAGRGDDRRGTRRRDVVLLVLFFLLSCGVGGYALLHLPVIDFLPFRVGVNIPQAMRVPEGGDTETTLVYRDRFDGSEHEFTLNDTVWYDTVRWEYVDTRIVTGEAGVPAVREFAVFDARQDVTSDVLDDPGRVWLLCVTDPARVKGRCLLGLEQAAARARKEGARVLCVTPAPLEGPSVIRLGAERVPCYNIDGTTLKTLLRARAGLVVLEGGTIVEKRNCRDLPLR